MICELVLLTARNPASQTKQCSNENCFTNLKTYKILEGSKVDKDQPSYNVHLWKTGTGERPVRLRKRTEGRDSANSITLQIISVFSSHNNVLHMGSIQRH